MTSKPLKKACVLGATGCIGFELTAHLLTSGVHVVAVVRNETKFQEMISARLPNSESMRLDVIQIDLFSAGALSDSDSVEMIMNCDYIFNVASKPLSLAPWSRTNREWGGVVSQLTKQVICLAAENNTSPHVVAFCGPEYFPAYDGKISLFQKALTKVFNNLIAGLGDNHEEATFLLRSGYPRWSVLRCGSIRPQSGKTGDASRIGMSLHKDGSDYRQGKGKSLIVEDLAAYLANAVETAGFVDFEQQMPFLFNTRF